VAVGFDGLTVTAAARLESLANCAGATPIVLEAIQKATALHSRKLQRDIQKGSSMMTRINHVGTIVELTRYVAQPGGVGQASGEPTFENNAGWEDNAQSHQERIGNQVLTRNI